MKIVLKTIRGEMKNILQDSKYNKANVFVDGIVDINSEGEK